MLLLFYFMCMNLHGVSGLFTALDWYEQILQAKTWNFGWIKWKDIEMSVNLCGLGLVNEDLKNSISLKT
jgi:uncharacterized protein YjdB